MKIVHKLILVNVFDVLLIAVTGFFAFHNLNLVLTKLRFMEIADDLNASFLEMRLSEKNFFLYEDKSALPDIHNKLDESGATIDFAKEDIVRAIGESNFARLETSFKDYARAIKNAEAENPKNGEVQARVRELGQKLREFSSRLTRLERSKLNEIVSGSRTGLFSSLCLILLSAFGVSQLISRKVLHSLKDIEKVARFISEGNFSKVESDIPPDELGSVMRAINSMSDELKNREEMIVQSKKLASIGILTAGVAHELGNPLNNISMLAQAYVELYDNLSREDRIDFMNKVEEETERIKEIVKNLLDFAKPKELHLKAVGINDTIKKSLKLVHNMICVCNIEVQPLLQDGLPPVMIDEHQILEVLINLITNAIQAGSPRDTVTITSSLSNDRGSVEIEVRDRGKGISSELLPYVFDPFFTTKGADGTGLGLFVSYGIIKNHGGNLMVSSELGKGTCFTIQLPAHNDMKGSKDEQP
ncbi:ATP-binding protein [Desulforhabdus amnigena]|uniref:histidine kinase n=1 Tax=Desulforhabdus amnigena TaxID=40218 RepID=A0A9W6D1F6_9BACT|nr:ATP-binding protein [Desulforhabdus amnigena]GLI34110.1 two-component sensor histidine kinase [Desulforhabdus amnigena]